jgi:translation initiation factor IF-1
MFRVILDNGHETLGYTAGKMRRYRIRIFPGDRIKLELSAYDLAGRILARRVVDCRERPVGRQPLRDGPPERGIELRMCGPHP